jgi:transcriptional regulator with XRE-family HTH domain
MNTQVTSGFATRHAMPGATVPTMPPSRRRKVATTKTYTPMNPLSRLILRRKDELDLSWYDIADRGGFSSHTIVYALAKKAEHRQTPRAETLTRLARALDLPLDLVRVAAAEAAGYQLTEVGTTLEAAEDVRVVASIMAELSPRDRAKLRRLAQSFVEEAREDATGGAAREAELSDLAASLDTSPRKTSTKRAKRP